MKSKVYFWCMFLMSVFLMPCYLSAQSVDNCQFLGEIKSVNDAAESDNNLIQESPFRGDALLSGKRASGFCLFNTQSSHRGFVSFDLDDAGNYVKNATTGGKLAYAGAYHDGYIYAYMVENSAQGARPFGFSKFNVNTWEETIIADYKSMKYAFADCSYDYAEDKMYFVAHVDTKQDSQLGVVDLTDGKITLLGSLGKSFITLACNRAGQLYGLDNIGQLHKIDKNSRALTPIGKRAINLVYMQSMEFDRDNDRLYWSTSFKDKGYLAEINIETGTSTCINNYAGNSELSCLYIPFSVDGTPAQNSNFEVVAGVNGGKNVSISFTTPNKTVDGKALTTITKVEIYRGDVLIKTFDKPAVGTKLTYSDVVANDGSYTYKVLAINSVGGGVPVAKRLFVGEDLPVAPANIVLSDDGGVAKLKWDAPISSINGAWVDYASLKYRVVRYPDNVIIARDCAVTEIIDEGIDNVNIYSYSVQSIAENGSGGIGISNKLRIGDKIKLPYHCNFNIKESFDLWTIIDANNDQKTWMHSKDWKDERNYYAKYPYTGISGNDWIMSPTVYLKAGSKYRISFDVSAGGSTYREALKVYYGKSATVEGQTNELLDLSEIKDMELKNHAVEFVVTESGDYNFGFKAYSFRLYIVLDNITIEEVADKDMAIINMEGPLLPHVDKEYIYTASVHNCGSIDASNYKVQLLDKASNVLVDKVVTNVLAAGNIEKVELYWKPQQANIGEIDLRMRVVMDGDKVPNNDISKYMLVDVQSSGIVDSLLITSGDVKTTYVPFNFYYSFQTVSQTIYYKSELGVEGGKINKITYYYNHQGAEGELLNHFKIYMASVQEDDLSKGWIAKEHLTLVFEGDAIIEYGERKLEFTLTKPFVHTGGNLCVMNEKSQLGGMLRSITFDAADVKTDRSRCFIRDGGQSEFDFSQKGLIENAIPNIKIDIESGSAGKIEGITKDINGNVLSNVDVKLMPVETTVKSNADGKYEFGFVPEGEYSLSALLYGYQLWESTNTIKAETYKTSVQDITLVNMPQFKAYGAIQDADGKVVSGASLTLKGYADYKCETNAEGKFEIQDVYKCKDYALKITKQGLRSYQGSVIVDSKDVNLGVIVLEDVVNPPYSLTANLEGSNVVINIEAPVVTTTFKYDDGKVFSTLGFTSGNDARSVMGVVHRVPATLVDMSWYTVGSAEGPHELVDCYVFDLDETGKPIARILYRALGVANRDDKWTTHNFTQPIDAPRGFFVAIASAGGYLGLACDNGDVFKPNTNYVAINYENNYFTPLGPGGFENMSYNFFIRAGGYDMNKGSEGKYMKISDISESIEENMRGKIKQVACETIEVPENTNNSNSRSNGGYRLWRLNQKDMTDETKWTLLTPTVLKETTFNDDKWNALGMGVYVYAAKAIYTGNILSEAKFSDILAKDMIARVTVNVTTNTPVNESDGARVLLTYIGTDAKYSYAGVVENGKVIFDNVWKGNYSVEVIQDYFDGLETTVLIEKSAVELRYELNATHTTPYNLTVSGDDNDLTRELSWNVFQSVNEDFESHKDFEINSPGSIGWKYIDGDKSKTNSIAEITFPNQQQAMAGIIFNPSKTTPSMAAVNEIKPKSGSKFLGCFSNPIDTSNDWIITPELSFVEKFTFSFWAKSFVKDFGLEKFRVVYSTTGMKESDFRNVISIGNYEEAPAEAWKLYSYEIPSTAKYVAINYINQGGFLFMVDDIFVGVPKSRSFTKYEIYLDNELVGTTPATYFNFSDLPNVTKEYTAGVKAIYSSGSSLMSNVKFKVKGMDGISEEFANELCLYPNPVKDILNIYGDYDILEIYNSTGQLMKRVDSGNRSVDVRDLSNGVYIIKAYYGENINSYKMIK